MANNGEIVLHRMNLQGEREANEDADSFVMNMTRSGRAKDSRYAPIDLFIVCDGHGGSLVSKYCIDRLQHDLLNPRLSYPLDATQIKTIYDKIQNDLINHPNNIAKNCGSTALVVARYSNGFSKSYLQVLNAGDCRAVLSRKGLAIPLTKDHKPSWPDERRRFAKINAKNRISTPVVHDENDWRINGFSVSRSFGDLDGQPHLTHLPDTYSYEILPEDEFIIIACDGFWDVVNNQQAVNFLKDSITGSFEFYGFPPRSKVKKFMLKNLAHRLCDYAISLGTQDNVTVMVLMFK